MRIIRECADAWKDLVRGKTKPGNISLYVSGLENASLTSRSPSPAGRLPNRFTARDNTTLSGTPGKIDPDKVQLPPDEDLSPAPIHQDLEEWFFVDRDTLEPDKVSLEGSDLHIELDVSRPSGGGSL